LFDDVKRKRSEPKGLCGKTTGPEIYAGEGERGMGLKETGVEFVG